MLALYPVATYGSPRRALVQVTTDGFFGCQARQASRVSSVEPLQRVDVAVSTQSGWRNTECDFWDGVARVSIPAPP